MYLYGLETIGTLLLAIVGFVVVLFAQFRITASYSKFLAIPLFIYRSVYNR